MYSVKYTCPISTVCLESVETADKMIAALTAFKI